MDIKITEFDNFTKIDINDIVSFEDFLQQLNKHGFEKKIDYEAYNYDRLNSTTDFIKEKTIYIFNCNNSYYTLSSSGGKTVITKRTIYDEKYPHTTQTRWYKEDDDISEYDKKFHIDDKMVLIDTLEKYFIVANKKHGLYHGSTFYNKWYNSKPYLYLPWEKYKDDFLILAKELIEEIKKFKNVESMIDLTALDIIPKHNIKILTKDSI